MVSLTIPNVPPEMERELRARAERAGRSIEAEARALLIEQMARSEPAGAQELGAKVKRLQAVVAHYIPPGSYSVDEFLAERRAETMREEAEFADERQRQGAPELKSAGG